VHKTSRVLSLLTASPAGASEGSPREHESMPILYSELRAPAGQAKQAAAITAVTRRLMDLTPQTSRACAQMLGLGFVAGALGRRDDEASQPNDPAAAQAAVFLPGLKGLAYAAQE
jgi:hypothetical protein